MASGEVRTLMWKEWRQLRRNRRALASALLLPGMVLLIAPASQMIGLWNAAMPSLPSATHVGGLPGLEDAMDNPRGLVHALMPLFVALGGLLVPAITATHTLIVEREARTLELLAGLPVRIGQILLAKLLVIVLLGGGASVLLVAFDGALILAGHFGTVGYVVALLVLLLCALGYSTASALLTSLLSRDFRTANNVNGVLLAPTLLACITVLGFVHGGLLRIYLLAALFAVGALVATAVSLRVVTFERLLR